MPVIKNADHLNLKGLTLAVNDLSGRARSNSLKPEEISDGTYTVTNVGNFGSIMGLLETRLLDFENVIITNLNEGILPPGKIHNNFFPYEVRKKFKLPTFLDYDLIYSHHFRLPFFYSIA